jgi:hypothetical protein
MFKMLWNKTLLFFGLKSKPKKELLNEVEKTDEPKVKRLVYQKRT